jgi:autotransporter-associated beta strand protein
MKVDLKRIFRAVRKLLAAGTVAAALLAGGAGTSRAALVLSNGSFENPNVGNSYGYYSVGFSWISHNLGASYGGGTHGTGNNGNLVQYAESSVSTGGMSTGSQYGAAVLWDTPSNVFSGSVGTRPSGMYVDQTIGTVGAADASATYTLSADLIRIIGQVADLTATQSYSPSVAGTGITIGFVNANTRAILAQKPISYTASYAAGDLTPVKITNSVTWNPSSSGVAAGTPINAFIGFRLDSDYVSNYLNSVAVDNVVLSSNLSTLTWTGADGTSPTQWSTNPSVLNWSSGGNSVAYTTGASVTFDDSVGGGSTVVDLSVSNVQPASVVFNNSSVSYTLQGTHSIVGPTTLNVAGGGGVTINNSNTFTGDTTISGGVLTLGTTNGLVNSTVSVGVDDGLAFAMGITSPTIGGLRGEAFFSLADAASNPVNLTVGGNNATTTFSGGMSNAGGLTKVGSGSLVLTGPNTYAGTSTISGGSLQLGSGEYVVSLGSGSVVNNATLVLSCSNHVVPIPAAISGSGSVVQKGTSLASIGQPFVSLSSLPSGTTNTDYQTSYSAGNTGVLTTNSAWAPVVLPAAGGGQPIGALFMVRSNSPRYGAFVEPTNTDRTSALDFSGPGTTGFFRWNGSVWNYLGVGLLGTNSQSAAANTYTGPTTVSAGTLALLTPGSLSPTAPTTVAAGATLDLGVGSQAVGSLIGAGTVNTMSFNLSVGGDNSKQTFSGVINGSGGLIKTGTGSLTLTGTDTYTGGTWVNRGKLIVANQAAIASGSNLYIGNTGLLSLFPEEVVPSPVAGTTADPQAAPVAAVPEPGTLALLAAAAIVAATRNRIKSGWYRLPLGVSH